MQTFSPRHFFHAGAMKIDEMHIESFMCLCGQSLDPEAVGRTGNVVHLSPTDVSLEIRNYKLNCAVYVQQQHALDIRKQSHTIKREEADEEIEKPKEDAWDAHRHVTFKHRRAKTVGECGDCNEGGKGQVTSVEKSKKVLSHPWHGHHRCGSSERKEEPTCEACGAVI
jgi:hypothetical protein